MITTKMQRIYRLLRSQRIERGDAAQAACTLASMTLAEVSALRGEG
jgi:hypothetical protein